MEIDSIILYESEYVGSLYPFSVLHCGWELRCGAFRIFEKVQRQFPKAQLFFSGREKQRKLFLSKFNFSQPALKKGNILILYSSILPTFDFWYNIGFVFDKFSSENPGKSVAFCYQSVPLAIFISQNEIVNPIDFDVEFLPKLLSDYQQILPKVEIEKPMMLNFLWDAIEYNSLAINDDKRFFENNSEIDNFTKKGVFLVNKQNILIGKNVQIQPASVLVAEEGPIIIGNSVKIMAGSTITGPCFIGDNSTIKMGAKIYEGCSFGEFCKVGGEVENSIIQSYSNKQHEGYLGHSFLSEWVNIGAGTYNSDLKNTYSNIVVRIKNERFNTGRMFLGLICGDHTKTAIMTRFNTGTIAGIGGILFHSDFLSGYIPSFCYGGGKDSKVYPFEQFLQTADMVMKRRGKELSEPEKELLSEEFKSINDAF